MKLTFKNYLAAVCLALAIFGLNACVKDRNLGATDFDNIAPTVSIVEGGLAKFGSQALLFPAADSADGLSFRVNYAAKAPAPQDITVTLAYDDAARVANNLADTTHPNYQKFPDSIYAAFPTTKVVIKKGQYYSDPINFVLYPRKVDPSINYIFPISIVDAQGVTIASNFKTIYYHLIGNPQAGSYTNTGIRYNYNCCTSVPYTYPTIPPGYSSTLVLPNPKVASPVDPHTVRIDFANLGGANYAYLATVPTGISGNTNFPITLNFSPEFLAGNANIVVNLATYNPALRTFHFNVSYLNNILGNPGFRIVDEVLVKP